MLSTKQQPGEKFENLQFDISNTLVEVPKTDFDLKANQSKKPLKNQQSRRKSKAKSFSKAKGLKVICYILEAYQLQTIDDLVAQDIYFNRSEINRVASRNLLRKLNKEKTHLQPDNWFIKPIRHLPAESVSSKLPQILLSCIDSIDESIIPSRSEFMREAIDQFLQERELFHNYFLDKNSYNTENKKLKVIAFKLPEEHIENINQLCQEGFYPSLSETVRIAIIDYLITILQYNNEMENTYWLSLIEQKHLYTWNQELIKKESACSKMPLQLLKIVDDLIKRNPAFQNRTNFIRLAVQHFLEEDGQIYSPYLTSIFKKTIKN